MPQTTADGRPRSATGHILLPAFHGNDASRIPIVTTQTLLSWTLGRGTVIWRIWPAVLLHTVFAAAVVSISLETKVKLGIPNVMLTLCGVVIGFVISYRASSGYDRYWQGRSAWGDLARTARTFSRLVWIHVPLKVAPVQLGEDGRTPDVDTHVARRVMAEKRTALDLIEGYVVAVKHHLRGEMGIYYEDLYPLVKPLHDHEHNHVHKSNSNQPTVDIAKTVDLQPEVPAMLFTLPSPSPVSAPMLQPFSCSSPSPSPSTSGSRPRIEEDTFRNPVIPPINAYGTFASPPSLHPYPERSASTYSDMSDVSGSSDPAERRPLLPGQVPGHAAQDRGLFGNVKVDLIPFGSLWRGLAHSLGFRRDVRTPEGRRVDVETGMGVDEAPGGGAPNGDGILAGNGVAHHVEHETHLGAKLIATSERLGITHSKHRPRIAGGGENLPLEVLRSLSVWVSVLDERGVVPGAALGGMLGCIAAFEDSLSTLERILTTPLPFVYSVHIRHTVWIYLFFLPFQLVDLFGWYAIPGVGFAAFIYLGLVAAGEEIEQPFGYDENDLDLDFFCRAIVHADIQRIQRVACPNVYLGPHHDGSRFRAAHEEAVDLRTRIENVFGGGRYI